ncbi:MAG: ABC transporter permease [Candidatus Sumerlaeaceae bacterium]
MIRRLFQFQELGLLLVIVLTGALLTVYGGNTTALNRQGDRVEVNKFLRADNLVQLAKNTSFFAIMAVGASLVILSGGIDLSVGSIYALSAVAGAMVLHRFGVVGSQSNAPPVVAVTAGIAACLLVGALCGLINGLLVVLLRVHPFIITLGTMAAFRGVAFVCPSWFASEGSLAIGQSIGDFPTSFTDKFIRLDLNQLFGRAGESGLYPIPMVIMVVVTAIGAWVLRSTVFGRRLFALGSNEQAARYCGVPIAPAKILVYTISGLMCGIAATIMLGYYGSASSDAGNGYELGVIASAVVGGASLSGGRGSAFGALLGALILQMIYNAIIILRWDQNYSQIIIGVVIIIAVVLDRVNTLLLRRQGAVPKRDKSLELTTEEAMEG